MSGLAELSRHFLCSLGQGKIFAGQAGPTQKIEGVSPPARCPSLDQMSPCKSAKNGRKGAPRNKILCLFVDNNFSYTLYFIFSKRFNFHNFKDLTFILESLMVTYHLEIVRIYNVPLTLLPVKKIAKGELLFQTSWILLPV